jgi:hypothetical protein
MGIIAPVTRYSCPGSMADRIGPQSHHGVPHGLVAGEVDFDHRNAALQCRQAVMAGRPNGANDLMGFGSKTGRDLCADKAGRPCKEYAHGSGHPP